MVVEKSRHLLSAKSTRKGKIIMKITLKIDIARAINIYQNIELTNDEYLFLAELIKAKNEGWDYYLNGSLELGKYEN